MPLYKHKFYEKQSECVKHRGSTSQIDITDSIITVLAKYPGLTGEEVAAKIFPPELGLSRRNVIKRLAEMAKPIEIDENASEDDKVEVPILVTDGEFYFLFYDAWTHDIGKTKGIMDKMNSLGIDPAKASFLLEGVNMYADEVKQGKHKNTIVAEPIEMVETTFSIDEDTKIKLRSQAIEDLKAERLAKEEADRKAEVERKEREAIIEANRKERLAKEEIEKNERLAKAKAEAEYKIKKETYDNLPFWKKLFTSKPSMN